MEFLAGAFSHVLQVMGQTPNFLPDLFGPMFGILVLLAVCSAIASIHSEKSWILSVGSLLLAYVLFIAVTKCGHVWFAPLGKGRAWGYALGYFGVIVFFHTCLRNAIPEGSPVSEPSGVSTKTEPNQSSVPNSFNPPAGDVEAADGGFGAGDGGT